jgi:hypothetical protein
MRRCLEPVDLMVVVGVCATAIAAHFFFIAANGTLQRAVRGSETVSQSPNIMQAMEWLQPALGQALTQDTSLTREASQKIMEAAMQLNRAIVAVELTKASDSVWLEQIRLEAVRATSEHTARVQYVLGRSIVDFTTRGVRTGPSILPDYSRRMIDRTRARGERLEAQFRDTEQSRLGREIMFVTQQLQRLREQVQQRLGQSIVALTATQHRYQVEFATLQEQIGAIAVASARTEIRSELLERLAAASYPRAETSTFAAPRSWPDVPVSLMFTAVGMLTAIFLVGLRLAFGSPEQSEEQMRKAEREPTEIGPEKMEDRPELIRYRKSA